jgi:2'-5' RNA ligase
MPKPGSLVVVHMLDSQEVGSYFDRSRWPLHITLLQWFEATQEQHREVRQELARIAQDAVPVTVIVGSEAMLGPDETVAVDLIADKTVLRPLHQALYDAVHLLQLPLESEQYDGENYLPHVARQPGHHYVTHGQQIRVDDMYLVQLVDGPLCQILARFELRGVAEQRDALRGSNA